MIIPEHKEKDKFIRELGEVFRNNNVNNIAGMRYENDGFNEHCYITYNNGTIRDIVVTYDSLTAIIGDILKQGGLT